MDIALPAEGVFPNLDFVSIRKTCPMQAYKIMHGLWGMGQMLFTKYIVVVELGHRPQKFPRRKAFALTRFMLHVKQKVVMRQARLNVRS